MNTPIFQSMRKDDLSYLLFVLGAEKGQPSGRAHMHAGSILKERYENVKPTVMSMRVLFHRKLYVFFCSVTDQFKKNGHMLPRKFT
ncbi:hypothetical protein KSZ_06740 [Dictyobacter formicarum]|uniref:Uncharacterized protein n=1 Tax=Dictyobacter formicarum TaxID=2778368 RepID=A0ABQ3VB76_9CHLR|nr:hypothetical protein KSZ_06740 [Dictyobacter formicarum]